MWAGRPRLRSGSEGCVRVRSRVEGREERVRRGESLHEKTNGFLPSSSRRLGWCASPRRLNNRKILLLYCLPGCPLVSLFSLASVLLASCATCVRWLFGRASHQMILLVAAVVVRHQRCGAAAVTPTHCRLGTIFRGTRRVSSLNNIRIDDYRRT